MILLQDSERPEIVSPAKSNQHAALSNQPDLFTAKAAKGAKEEILDLLFSLVPFWSVAVKLLPNADG
jgi:hypothetical protein